MLLAATHGGYRMIINHNLSAMFANRLLGIQDASLNRNIEQLSSGL